MLGDPYWQPAGNLLVKTELGQYQVLRVGLPGQVVGRTTSATSVYVPQSSWLMYGSNILPVQNPDTGTPDLGWHPEYDDQPA